MASLRNYLGKFIQFFHIQKHKTKPLPNFLLMKVEWDRILPIKENQHSRDDPFWFQPYLTKWMILVTTGLGGFMSLLGFIFQQSFRMTGLLVFVIGGIYILLLYFEPYDFVMKLYFLSVSTFFIVDGAIRNLTANLVFLTLLLIASGILLNIKFTVYFYLYLTVTIIISTLLGGFTWGPQMDANTDLFYATSVSITLPVLIVGLMLALIIRKIIYENMIELAQSQNYLAATLQSIEEAVITTSLSGKIRFINPSAAKLTGYNTPEVVNKQFNSVFKIINEKTKQPIKPIEKTLIRKKHDENISKTAILLDRYDQEHICEYQTSAILNKSKTPIGYIINFRDITEKRQLLNEIIKSQKIDSISLLAGGIGHDFNNLLARIIGNLSLLQLELDNRNDLADYLEDIQKAAQHATDLTQQLLKFSKGGAPVKEASDFANMVRDTTQFLLRGTSVVYDFQVESDLPRIEFDKAQISQVIQNIIINAVQAMKGKGQLTITIKKKKLEKQNVVNLPEGNYICTTIKDTGPGIPQNLLAKIFDPYFTTKTTGHGLGLALSHSIVRKHNGTITVDSSLQQGCEFEIYLPI